MLFCKQDAPIAVLYVPDVFAFKVPKPIAVLLVPVCEPLANTELPTAVLVDTLPAPLPTVRPEMVASLVTVRFVNAVAPLVKAIVPLEEGNVIVVVPATAGAEIVTAPDVSPETTIELMSFPYKIIQR